MGDFPTFLEPYGWDIGASGEPGGSSELHSYLFVHNLFLSWEDCGCLSWSVTWHNFSNYFQICFESVFHCLFIMISSLKFIDVYCHICLLKL